MIGSASAVIGYTLASLESRQRLHAMRIERLGQRILKLDDSVASVDVYNLRISNLEKQVAANIVRLRATEIILNDLKSDLRVLYDRQRPPPTLLPSGERKTRNELPRP